MNKITSDLLIQMWKQAALHANKADSLANDHFHTSANTHAQVSLAYSQLILAFTAAHG